jgi:hypothetical protein
LNENGQLGLAHQKNENVPKRLESEHINGQKIISVVCGAYHTLAIVGNSTLYSLNSSNFQLSSFFSNFCLLIFFLSAKTTMQKK